MQGGEIAQMGVQIRGVQIRGVGGKAQKGKAKPFGDVIGPQAVVGAVEGGILHMGCCRQRAIQPVGPGVKRAADAAAVAPGQGRALPIIRTVGLADDWRHWATVLRVGAPARFAHTVDSHLLAVELARQGLGVALVCRILVAADIVAGRLVVPWTGEVAAQEGYILGPEAPDGQQALNLRRFLMDCAKADPQDVPAVEAE